MVKTSLDETLLEKKLDDLRRDSERAQEQPGSSAKRIAELRAVVNEIKSGVGAWLARMDHTSDLVNKTFADIPGPAALAIFLDDRAEAKLIAAVESNWPKNALSDSERTKRLKDIDAEMAKVSRDLCEIYHAAIDAGLPVSPSPLVRPQDFLGLV